MEIATGVLRSLIPKLALVLTKKYKLRKRLKEEIVLLTAELESMKAAMEKISKTPPDQRDARDKIWVREAREICYDVEDIIDPFMVRNEAGEVDSRFLEGFMINISNLLRKVKAIREVSIPIRDINSHLKEIFKWRRRYEVIDNFVGIEEARDELIQFLMEGNAMSKQQGNIVSIAGIGGLGKTTLAKIVCEKLREQFDYCAFVSVSQYPDIKNLFKQMLYQFGTNVNEERLDETQLINELRDFLQDKRYFTVIDDVWDIKAWDMIRCALPDNNRGYKIIITTRIIDVASQVGSLYMLKPLSFDCSKKLLYKRIFGNEDIDRLSYAELSEVSNQILKKCVGIPLAINTVAGVLAARKRNKSEWDQVYEEIVSLELENDVQLMDTRIILSLGYRDLPPHLKTCFLYLSVFPKNYDIDKNHLIWLWIAEGLIHGEKIGQSQFELGESYFYELTNRSLIQLVQKKGYDMIEYCRVHDTLHDFIYSISSDEIFVTIVNDVHPMLPSDKVRRLSVQNRMLHDATPWATMSMQHVRSVSVFSSVVYQIPALSSFNCLRVMNLENSNLSQGYSLEYLGNLFHLRYLGLRDTNIAHLPEDIGNLRFLQTLDITGNELSSLPSTVVQLKSLMCLHIGSWTRVLSGIRSLTSLEELSTVCISDNIDTIDELGHLKELRVLSIDCRIQWTDALGKSLVECLHKLQKIQTLSISVYGECNLDAWDAPRHLRRLELSGCWLSTLSSWMNPSLLMDLSFLSIEVRNLHQEDLETLWRLPSLRYLDLEVNHEYTGIPERFVVGAGSFPCLVHCVLRGSVGHVVFQQGAMPRLTSLCFTFAMREMRETADRNGYSDLGLGNLPSLENLTVSFLCEGASEEEMEEAEAALKHAAAVHPNQPSLEIH